MARKVNRAHLEGLVDPKAARAWPRPNRRRLLILFTPRSGSSWFGDLLRSTGALGNPEEFLNQDINAEVVRRFGARTEIDYLNAVEANTATPNGVFSMEVIWGHIELCEIDLLGYYRDAHFVYLRRKDILAQAISLLLATQSGVFHNAGDGPSRSQADVAERLVSVEVTLAAIRSWWGHLLNYECLAEVQLAIRGIRPLRLYYEDIVGDPAGTVARVLAHCGVSQEGANPPNSAHQPVRGALNDELAQLFRTREAEFVRIMDSFRPPLV
jgi:LPS sulfotransferase NodH